MDLLPFVPDNISEVLIRIIRFTNLRQDLLQQNITAVDTPGYVPHDLPVCEFAEALGEAVAEHLQNHRLLFRDGAQVRFGTDGRMDILPIVDEPAAALLREDPDAYLALQATRLRENGLNRTVAQELLRRTNATAFSAQPSSLDEVEAANQLSADCPRPGK
jgi:hypothetical protein